MWQSLRRAAQVAKHVSACMTKATNIIMVPTGIRFLIPCCFLLSIVDRIFELVLWEMGGGGGGGEGLVHPRGSL